MQKVTRFFQLFLSAILLTAVIGCASDGNRQSTGEYVDDAWITSKVKAAMIKDDELKASEINVETYNGTVQLSGFVSDASDVNHASSVARGIKGVTNVKNDLQVK